MSVMAAILVTGFEPFRHWRVNSSREGALRLAALRGGVAVAILPVDHVRAVETLGRAVAEHRPAAVLLTGLAPDPAARLETVARPGPLAPWSGATRTGRWNWSGALAAMRGAGLPVRLSADAGGYVCDTTYWAALGLLAAGVPVAFLHLPPPGPVWTADRAARAIGLCLDGGLGAAAARAAAGA